MNGPHPSHKTRFCYDASTYDEICTLCYATDTPGGWGRLAHPCPKNPQAMQEQKNDIALRLACHLEDDPPDNGDSA